MDTKDTPPPTLDEVKLALKRTEDDHNRLSLIIENLSLFIYDTDQDRKDMVPALQQFQGLMNYCDALRTKIREVKEKMEQGEN